MTIWVKSTFSVKKYYITIEIEWNNNDPYNPG